VLILKTLGKMVVGQVSLKHVTGPITIADYAGQTAKIGWFSYVSFLALISISLGVMNLLPIPILDGGHLLYYALEVLTGRPVPPRYWEVGQRLGVAVLVLLMAVAFFNDIARLLPS
jgi:regulator of sigma E protease